MPLPTPYCGGQLGLVFLHTYQLTKLSQIQVTVSAGDTMLDGCIL